MRSVTRGNIKAAANSLRATKWRSFFTILGIVIGIVSVVTIVSIGQGIKHAVSGQISQLGKDLITVRPGQIPLPSSSAGGLGVLAHVSVNGELSQKDLQTVQAAKGVERAVPLSVIGGSVKGDKPGQGAALVIGTTPQLPDVLNNSLADGAFFSDSDAGNVAIIGQGLVSKLFNVNVPLGRSITFRGQQFVVEGVFNQFDTAPLSIDVDFNNAIFIPYKTAQQITGGDAPIYEILAKPSKSGDASATVASVQKSLLKIHGDPHDFTVLTQKKSQGVTNSILDMLTTFISGVAAISLLVGGIGVMNIMLVSVSERTHEIGVMKAVGATNRQILNAFVIEATVLSVAGGILGIILSFIIDILLRLFTNLTPIITWQIVLWALGVSIAVGVIFGSAPALKAARKDPIAALRNE